MKTVVSLCRCGGNIADKIDLDQVAATLNIARADLAVFSGDFPCSEDGQAELADFLRANGAERLVAGACSPREHEATFMAIATQAGLNPYLVQLVNLREQNAWVTADPAAATAKAAVALTAAIDRVVLHEPLASRAIDVETATLVLGAGPAGLKAALLLAEAGRQVILVDKEANIGGLPVLYEELFPAMECGPCLLEPLMGEALHGPHAAHIELLTQTELVSLVGSFGNFTATLRATPRHIDPATCIGCGECVAACPAAGPNARQGRRGEKRAVDFTVTGALPNAPFIDRTTCQRFTGADAACSACQEACPVPEAILYDQEEILQERTVGAVLVATGAGLYEGSALARLGYGQHPDIITAFEAERQLSSTGPTGGELTCADGSTPQRVAIVHCAGSLDPNAIPYCSGICCQVAFKFAHLIAAKHADCNVAHFARELVFPGAAAGRMLEGLEHAAIHRYQGPAGITVDPTTRTIACGAASHSFDLIILCPPVVPAADQSALAACLDTPCERSGFFAALHPRTDNTQSQIKGIYLAGSCRGPADISTAMTQGGAAAGQILSALVPGRQLEISPLVARVDEERCAGCRVCGGVCPYRAIGTTDTGKAAINDVLCHGCGTCAAACPAGAICARHFTREQLAAELTGVLSCPSK